MGSASTMNTLSARAHRGRPGLDQGGPHALRSPKMDSSAKSGATEQEAGTAELHLRVSQPYTKCSSGRACRGVVVALSGLSSTLRSFRAILLDSRR